MLRRVPDDAPVRSAWSPSTADTSTAEFAEDVRYYLTQSPRQLPSRYLYDALGSALFDAICQLPWYARHAQRDAPARSRTRSEILSAMRPLARIIELGAGNGRKLETLLASAGPPPTLIDVHLIDVSPQALRTAAGALNGIRQRAHPSARGDV